MKKFAHVLEWLGQEKKIQFEERSEKWVDMSPHDIFRLFSYRNARTDLRPEHFRVKPATIKIGDMEVPEPCREPLEIFQEYWLARITEEDVTCSFDWKNDKYDRLWLKHGLIHTTKEAAELCRVALIKVSGGEP